MPRGETEGPGRVIDCNQVYRLSPWLKSIAAFGNMRYNKDK